MDKNLSKRIKILISGQIALTSTFHFGLAFCKGKGFVKVINKKRAEMVSINNM